MVEWAVKCVLTGEVKPVINETGADTLVEIWKDTDAPYVKVSRTVTDWK